MDVKTFVLQTLLAIVQVHNEDNATDGPKTPRLVCTATEIRPEKVQAACGYTMGDGSDVTVVVLISRPHLAKPAVKAR